MSRIDALIADLQREGTVDSKGGFTLDRDKARAKMRQFQLADPREYLLQLIRAAHCQGATRIDLEIDADDMHLRFDGAPFTERDFEDLYDALFGRADDGALAGRRHLALGLNAALGLDPRRILVRSGAAQLVVVPEGEDDFGPLQPPIEGTWIHARDRVRFSNVFRFFQGLADGLPEARMVRERCGFSAVPVTLNGAPLPSGRATIEAQVEAFNAVEAGDAWAYGGVSQPGAPGQLHVIAGGVEICVIEVPGAIGFRAAAGSARLRTDVSQADVVRDAAFEEVMVQARAVAANALGALIEAGAADAHLDAELAVVEWRTVDEVHGADVAMALRGRVHGQTLGGDPVCLIDLDPAQSVQIVTFDFAERRASVGPLPDDLRPAIVADTDGPFGRAVAHRMIDRTPDLLAWLERAEGERDFRRRRVESIALHGDFEVRAPIAADPWQGEVGVARGESGRGWITWVLDDCALVSDRVDAIVPGLRGIISGPITPTPAFRGVAHDARFHEATRLFGHAVAGMMNMLPHDDWGRGIARRWLEAGKDGTPGDLVAQRLSGRSQPGNTVWLQALPTAPDALAAMPLFETMQGEHRSLADLAAQIAAGHPLACMGTTVRGPRVEPPILSAGPADKALLQAIFGRKAVISGAAQLARARAIEAFEAMPPRRLDLSFEAAEVVSQARFTDGAIGLRRRAISAPSGWFSARVQPYSRGRPLKVVELALPLPGVIGAVEVRDRPLNANLDGLEDPSRSWLLERLIPHLDALFTPGMRVGPARRFLRALIDLWVPTDAHHAAWIRWDDADAYRAALRHGWHAGGPAGALAGWSVEQVPRDAPAHRINEAILAPMFAASGSLAERLRRAYPRLAATRTFRAIDGPDASLDDIAAGIDAHGVALHASRASVFPEGFGGVTLKTEHAQLERLARLVGPEALARATSWKAEHALARAVEAAPVDPGSLPAGTRAVVPIDAGEIGLPVPFDPRASSAIQVVMAGRVVAVLEPSTSMPIVGRVAPGDAARMVLSRGALGVDDLTRVRVLDQATRAVDDVVRALLDEQPGPAIDALLRGVLAARARGKTQRGLLKNDALARSIAARPLFHRLDGDPVALLRIIEHRRRRQPLSMTWHAAAPAPDDPSHWVLVLDEAAHAVLEQVFSRSLPDYADDLAERAAARAFADKPVIPWALPDAAHVVEVSDGPVRALVGWGVATDRLTVLREGRALGEIALTLGIPGVGALAEDGGLPPTDAWRSDPRLRRVQRLVASGIPALGEVLITADPAGARDLIWRLLSAAFPGLPWVALYGWLVVEHTPREAQRHYHDALQAAAQGARYLLDRLVSGACPVTVAELLASWPWPQSSAGDRILRAMLNHNWPLAGDPKTHPLSRVSAHLGVLGRTPWIMGSDGAWLSMAEVGQASDATRATLTLEPAQRGLLDAIGAAWTAAQAADGARLAAALKVRQADAHRAAEQALQQRRADERRREREATRARWRREAEEQARQRAEEAAKADAEAQAEADAARPEVWTSARPEVWTSAPPTVSDPPTTNPAPPSPEAALIERIVVQLTAVQADRPRLLADVNLARLAAGVDGPLAQADGRRFTINTRHPTASAAMEGDAVAEFMVVSAAYTALNLWLEEITDAYELRVVEHLLALAARAPNRDGAPR